MKIKVTAPKRIEFLGILLGSYKPSFKLIAVKHFELLCRNGVFGQTGRQAGRQADRQTDRHLHNINIDRKVGV